MSFQDTWADAPVADNNDTGQPPEPGDYTIEITDAAAVTSNNTGADWVIIEIRALDGLAEGHTWKVFQGFKTKQQAGFTKRVCRDLGVDIDNVESLGELDEQLKTTIGRYFAVQVKQNGEYRNTYFQGAVRPDSIMLPGQPPADEVRDGLDQAQERLTAATPVRDDDIPFLWDGPKEYADRYHANR